MGGTASNAQASKQAKRNGSKYGLGERQMSNGSAVEFIEEISPELMRDAISRILSGGDAVMIGATSDGGALVLTVMEGTERHKEYLTSAQQLTQLLLKIIA